MIIIEGLCTKMSALIAPKNLPPRLWLKIFHNSDIRSERSLLACCQYFWRWPYLRQNLDSQGDLCPNCLLRPIQVRQSYYYLQKKEDILL